MSKRQKRIDEILTSKQIKELAKNGYAVIETSAILTIRSQASFDRKEMIAKSPEELAQFKDSVDEQMCHAIRMQIGTGVMRRDYHELANNNGLVSLECYVIVAPRVPDEAIN